MADLFGQELHALQLVSETQAELVAFGTTDVLQHADVVGIYFSADWCGPCRKFTPELVSFYQKINEKKKKKNSNTKALEIVWISRCKDWESFGQYFATMPWLALPFEDSLGSVGEALSNKYGVKSIPSLVLVDGKTGAVITKDGRTKIPADKAGVGFPWRSPVSNLARNIVPGPIRRMLGGIKKKFINILRGILGMRAI
ncbi:hypothetical protein TrRE_jg5326 [Triparma retinervis]|uniref:Thioredoxin-like fold domain-containing protein n=1 Tax=Triparma retinervis TaxID=2557542 RepID=A0A9W7E358_9STRA|nr:hypothetical protein TrRE_jg5326 [Triparma retinervis]